MRADAITNQHSFEAWLNARPDGTRQSEAVALAHRAAMRVAIHLPINFNRDPKRPASMLKAGLRCNAISRVAVTLATSEIVVACAAASASIFESNASAAASAAACAVSVSVHSASAASKRAANAAAFADFAPNAWEEIRSDSSALSAGVAVAELMASPLWRAQPGWWKMQRLAFRQMLFTLDPPNHGFSIWSEWYDDAAFGKPIFGIRSKDIRTALERNIALGSVDGTFKKEFWERDTPEINADIARWVEEARQADDLAGSQRGGLKFKFQQGLIRLFPLYGLLAEGSNESRIRSQLPILRELVGGLKKKVGQLTADDDSLLDALTGLLSAISCEPEHIDASTLFTRTAVLRYHIEEANKDSGRLGVNRYVLSGGDMASAKGIALASDLVVLATKEGQELFDDADRAQLDAGQIDMLREVERKLLALLTSDGSLMDQESQTLLKQLFDVQPISPHPKRVFQAATASLQNAALVSVAVALGGTGLLTLSPILIAAIVGGAGFFKVADAFTKGTPFGDALEEYRKEKVSALGKMLLENEADIRAAAANRPSWKLVLDLLDRLKEEDKKKPK